MCTSKHRENTSVPRNEHYQELLAWESYSESPRVKAGKRSSWTMGDSEVQEGQRFLTVLSKEASRMTCKAVQTNTFRVDKLLLERARLDNSKKSRAPHSGAPASKTWGWRLRRETFLRRLALRQLRCNIFQSQATKQLKFSANFKITHFKLNWRQQWKLRRICHIPEVIPWKGVLMDGLFHSVVCVKLVVNYPRICSKTLFDINKLEHFKALPLFFLKIPQSWVFQALFGKQWLLCFQIKVCLQHELTMKCILT